jgi:rootletin
MRSEKDTLEAILFDTQSNLEAVHAKKVQLEKDKQDLLIKQEGLKNQIQRVTRELENSEKHSREIKQSLSQFSEKQEAEFQSVVTNMKKQNEEAIKKLNEEKVWLIELFSLILWHIVFLNCIIIIHESKLHPSIIL